MNTGQRSREWAGAALAAVGLTAATAVVAMAARAPLASSTPVDAASARAPVTGLFMLLIGTGIISLGALVILLWPRRGNDEPEFVPERPHMHWITKLLAILVPLAIGAALVTAAILGARSLNAPGIHGGQHVAGGGVARSVTEPAVPTDTGRGFVLPAWLPWTLIVIVGTGIGVGAIAFLLHRNGAVDESSDQGAARAAVQAAIGALDTDEDPRSAVIAAYLAMEGTFAAQGIVRSPAEAPREYLRRVLASSTATDREARTLTSLFEEARFSRHPISERVRELALASLKALRSRLHADGL